MKVFRLTKSRTISEAFNGQGASKYGGRWNSKNVKTVYCSDSISLCVLENLVHASSDLMPRLTLYSIDVPEHMIRKEAKSQEILNDPEQAAVGGDEWVRSGSSVALKVPSKIVPQEFNILLNPDHDDFRSLKPMEIGPFDLDSRLLNLEQ